MQKNQNGFGILEMFIGLMIVAVIISAGLYFIKGKARVSIVNNDTTFSFDMGIPANNTSHSGKEGSSQYYEAQLKDSGIKIVATAYIPKKTNIDKDIECRYSSFAVEILGKSHIVCDQKNLVFVANFDNNETWYQVAVFPKDMKTPLDQGAVSQLMNSKKVV